MGKEFITIYNVDLKAGDSTRNINIRRNEIQALKKLIENDNKRKLVYMIAGDMNTKDKVEFEELITQL